MSSPVSTSERPLRIAHLICDIVQVHQANGVTFVVRNLARAQAEIGQTAEIFSSVADPADTTRRSSRIFATALAERLASWQPDIVHFHSVHIPQHVALATHLRRTAVPYVVTPHGGLFPVALRRGRLKKALFQGLFERRFLNAALFIHAVSPHEVSALRKCGVTPPIVVVPNGVPAEICLQAVEPDALFRAFPSLRGRRIFMFVGRLDLWQKGLDLLVDAFGRARLPDAALVLVGPDSRGAIRTLKAQTDRHLTSPVVFTGPAFGQDLANLMAAADVFVHVSRWEGMSLSVLAAAAVGKPSLLTHDADPLGTLGHAGAAVIVGPTPDSIAEGLRQFGWLTPSQLSTMGLRAREVAEHQATWPSIAERLVQAYQSALTSQTWA